MELNFWETVRTSPTFIILFICSLIDIAFILERWLYFRRTRINAEVFIHTLNRTIREGGAKAAIEFCQRSPSPLAVVVRMGLQNFSLGAKSVTELMEAAALEEKLKLERYLSILGTLGNVAPFIGLFGTVVGIIRAFHDLAVSGSGGPSVVSAGIAEALITTAAGLVVAIPAVIAYNYFLRRVGTIMAEIEAASKKIRVILGMAQ
ncbi:MAG: MotA/TolQ/ExbB proton channel family protein [candidate division KSB1 bacterium]|nr:MotA/TolQ/ExbB proton channel family protein [candidate division KSB1 bacterium]MDZ7302054.1 MotA/TolQ/ExbB proton channel family protein [candidate division KSB1 bacterium]MDZ7311096.1 MotA/TolQ/ExbB proton channel family protein [candidate division KSB1 bacterium]